MRTDSYTIDEHMLDVGHKHQLYIQDWGNKNAKIPIIFLHGGPGAQCKDKHKTPFDPTTQRVIFFDQRGSGKSLPYGRWHHNNTQELAADITKIADYLKVDKFVLTGASWGSTLGLYYAISNPNRVKALVISGVWTASDKEIDWLNKGGIRDFFPEVWENYLTSVPNNAQSDPTAWHFERILGNDPDAAKKSAHAYACYDGALMSLDDTFSPPFADDFDPNTAMMEARYMSKRCFLPDRYILKNASKLNMPVYIVQGRYDMVCPPVTAYELSKLIKKCNLTWVTSGHKSERETITALRLIYKHLTEGH